MRTLATELAEPKYSHIERERRWFVSSLDVPDSTEHYVLIEDHYVENTRMRLRKMTDEFTGEISLKLTKKYDAGRPIARPLVTAYLDEAEYGLLHRMPGATLRKRRYAIEHGGRVWSLDQFELPRVPFLILEIEAEADVLEHLVPPSWVGSEITLDQRYSCANLAWHGPPVGNGPSITKKA